MSNFYFWSKYAARVVKMVTYAFIFGNTAYDLFFTKRYSYTNPLRGSLDSLNIAMWILIILSGVANMLLLIFEKKYEKDSSYQIWKKSLIVKFLLSIFITPMLEALISLGINDKDKIDNYAIPIRFSILVIFAIGSPYLRYYREENLKPTVGYDK
jgi:hypothetical protein